MLNKGIRWNSWTRGSGSQLCIGEAGSFSSCDYKVPFLCRAFCIRRKPVIGRAVMARREGEMSALMQLKKRLHLNVKVRRPTNPEPEGKKGGEPKERVAAEGCIPLFHLPQKR